MFQKPMIMNIHYCIEFFSLSTLTKNARVMHELYVTIAKQLVNSPDQ